MQQENLVAIQIRQALRGAAEPLVSADMPIMGKLGASHVILLESEEHEIRPYLDESPRPGTGSTSLVFPACIMVLPHLRGDTMIL